MIKLFVSRAFVKTKKFEFKESDSLKEIEKQIFSKFENPDHFEFYLHLDDKKNTLIEYKDLKKNLKDGNVIYAEQRPLNFLTEATEHFPIIRDRRNLNRERAARRLNERTDKTFNAEYANYFLGVLATSEINKLQDKINKASKVVAGTATINEIFGLFRTKGVGRLHNKATKLISTRERKAGDRITKLNTNIKRTFEDTFLIGAGDYDIHYVDIAGSGQDVTFGDDSLTDSLFQNTYKATYEKLTPLATVAFNIQRNQDFVLTDLDVNNLIPSNTILTNFGLNTLNEVYKAVDSVGLKFSETISNSTARFDFFETDWLLSVKEKSNQINEDKWSKHYYEQLTQYSYPSEAILDYILGIGYEIVADNTQSSGAIDLLDPEQNFNIVLDNATNSYKSASLISAELGENEIGQISGSYFLNQVTPAGIYFKLRSDKDVYLPRTSVASGASARERMKQDSIYSGSKQITGGASGNEASGKAVGSFIRDIATITGEGSASTDFTASNSGNTFYTTEFSMGFSYGIYVFSGSGSGTKYELGGTGSLQGLSYRDSSTLYNFNILSNQTYIQSRNPSTLIENVSRRISFSGSGLPTFIHHQSSSLANNDSDLIYAYRDSSSTTVRFYLFTINSDNSLTRRSSSDFSFNIPSLANTYIFAEGNILGLSYNTGQSENRRVVIRMFKRGSNGNYTRDSSRDLNINIGASFSYGISHKNSTLYLFNLSNNGSSAKISSYQGFTFFPEIIPNPPDTPQQSLVETTEEFPQFDDITSTVSSTDNLWTVKTSSNELNRIQLNSSPSNSSEITFTTITNSTVTSPEAVAYVRGEVLVYNGSNIKSYIASNLVERTSRSTDVTGLTGTVQSMTADSTHIAILTKGASGAYNVYFWNYTQSGRFTRNSAADFSFNESLLGTVASGNEIKGMFFAKGDSNTLVFTSTRTNKILCYTRASQYSYRRDVNKEVTISVNFGSYANNVFGASTYSRGYFILGLPTPNSLPSKLIFFDYSVTFNFNYNTEVDALDPEDQVTLPPPDKDPVKFDKLAVSERTYTKATGNARYIWALRGSRTIDVLNYDLESIEDDVIEVSHPYARDSNGDPYLLDVKGLDLHNNVLVVLASNSISRFQTILFYDTENSYNLLDYIELDNIDGEESLRKKTPPPSTKTNNKLKSSGSNRRTSKLRPSGASGNFFGLLAAIVGTIIVGTVGYMINRSLTDKKSNGRRANDRSDFIEEQEEDFNRIEEEQADSDGFVVNVRYFTDITFNGKFIIIHTKRSIFIIDYENKAFYKQPALFGSALGFSFEGIFYHYNSGPTQKTLKARRIDALKMIVDTPSNDVDFTSDLKAINSAFPRDENAFYLLGENNSGDTVFQKIDVTQTITGPLIELTGEARPLPEVTLDDPTDVPQPPPELEFTDSPFDITFNSIKSDSSSSIPSISFIKGDFVFTLDDIRSVTNGNTRQLSQVTTYDFKARNKSTKDRTPAEDFSITTSDLSSLSSGVTDFNGVTNNFASGTESLSELVKVLVKGDLYYLVMKTSTGKTARTLYAFDDTGSRSATDDIALSAFNPITKTAKSGRTFSERKMKLDQAEFIGDLLLVPYLQAYTATDGQRDEFYMVIAFDTAGSLVSYKVFDVGNFSNTSITEFTRQGMNFNFNDLTGSFTDGTDYFLKDNFSTPKRYRAYSPVIETEVSVRSFGLPTIPVNTGQTAGLYVVSDGTYVWFTGRRRTLYAFNLLSPTAVPSPSSNVDLAYKTSKDITFDGTNEVATTNGLKFTFRDGENVYTESSALTARSVSDTANITFACRSKSTGARLQSNDITITKSSLTSLMTKTSFTGSDVAVNEVKNAFLNGSYVYLYFDHQASASGSESNEGVPDDEVLGNAAGDRLSSSDITLQDIQAITSGDDQTNIWAVPWSSQFVRKYSLTGSIISSSSSLGSSNILGVAYYDSQILACSSSNIYVLNSDTLVEDSTRRTSIGSAISGSSYQNEIATNGTDIACSYSSSGTCYVKFWSYTSSGAFTRKSSVDFSFSNNSVFGNTGDVRAMFFAGENLCFVNGSANKVVVFKRQADGTYSRNTEQEFNLASVSLSGMQCGFYRNNIVYVFFYNSNSNIAAAYDATGLFASPLPPDPEPAYKLFAFNKSTGARSATNDLSLSDFTALTKSAPTGRTLQKKLAHLKDSTFVGNKLYTLCSQEYENATNSDGQTRFYFLMPFSLTGTATTTDAIDVNRVSITGSGDTINYSTDTGIHIDTDNLYRSLWNDNTDIYIRGNGYGGHEAFYPYNPTSKLLVNEKIMGVPSDDILGDATTGLDRANFNASDGTIVWFNGKNDTLFAYELAKAYVNFNNNYYIDLHLETAADTESVKLDIPYRTNFYFNDININKIVNVSLDYTFNVPTIKIVFRLTQEQYKTLGSASRIFIRETTGEFVFFQTKARTVYIPKRSFAQKYVDSGGQWSLVAPKNNSKMPVYVFEFEGANKTGIKGRNGADLILRDELTLASQRSTSYYMVAYPRVDDITGDNVPEGLNDLALTFTSETFDNSTITKLNCYRHTYAEFNPKETKTLTLGATLAQGDSITFDRPTPSGSLVSASNVTLNNNLSGMAISSTDIFGSSSSNNTVYKYGLTGGAAASNATVTGVTNLRSLCLLSDELLVLSQSDIHVLDEDDLSETSSRKTSLSSLTLPSSNDNCIETDGTIIYISYNMTVNSVARCFVKAFDYTSSGAFQRNTTFDFDFAINDEFGSSTDVNVMLWINGSLHFINKTKDKSIAFEKEASGFTRRIFYDMTLPTVSGTLTSAFYRNNNLYLGITSGSNTVATAVDASVLEGVWQVGDNPVSVYPERVFFSYAQNVSTTTTSLTTRTKITYIVNQYIRTLRPHIDDSSEEEKKKQERFDKENDFVVENIQNYIRALDTTLSFYVSRKIYDPIGDRFIESSNPANICLHLLSELYDSLDLPITFTDFVDTQSFIDFRTWCFDSANEFEFHGEFNSPTTYLDALQIVANAGRGTVLFGFGKISVHIDRSQTNVSQHFHAGNISSISIQKTFRKVPALLEAIFNDKGKGYEKNTLSVRTDPTDTTGNSKQTINVQGIVESDKVTDRLNFEIKKLNNQPEIYTITVDLASVRCEVGDLVGVNYEMLQASQFTGTVRKQNLSNNLVASVLINQDTAPELDPTKMYSFVVLNNDGTTLSIPVTSISDEKEPDSLTSELASDKRAFERKLRDSSMNTANRGQTFKKITFSSPANPTQVPVGARFIFGENTNVFKKALVLSIQSDSNLLGTVTLQEYIPAWYS